MRKPVDASKPEKQDTLMPLVKPTPYPKSPASVIEQKAGGSVLDGDLIKGLEKLNKLLLIYIVGSPLGNIIAFILAISFASLSLGLSPQLLGMILSLWPILHGLSFTPLEVFLGALFMLMLLAVGGGGLMILFFQYGYLLPAFRSLRKHDESFRNPLLLVGVGCIGPLMLLLTIMAMIMESASGKPVLVAPVLFWMGITPIVVGQGGLIVGLLKLRRKFDDSRFSAAAIMFSINIVLSLALSLLAVIAGLVGWILTCLATGSALKKAR
jgi:hypothetical protein